MRYFEEKTLQRRINYLTEFANMNEDEQDAYIEKLRKESIWLDIKMIALILLGFITIIITAINV